MNEDFRSRFRTNRRDYTGSSDNRQPSQDQPTPTPPHTNQPVVTQSDKKTDDTFFDLTNHTVAPKSKKHLSAPSWLKSPVMVMVILAVVLAGGSIIYFTTKQNSPVPKTISQGLNVPVYYPDPSKLPAGYSLDNQSFKKPHDNTVVYSVSYDTGKSLVFSVQPKPSDDQLSSLISRTIPLHNTYKVKAGTATIGVYQNQTVVLLPTAKALLIITGPTDIDQDQLHQVLSSIQS